MCATGKENAEMMNVMLTVSPTVLFLVKQASSF
jgi:hypothetical protein